MDNFDAFIAILDNLADYYLYLNFTPYVQRVWIKALKGLTLEELTFAVDKTIERFPPNISPTPEQILNFVYPWEHKAEKEWQQIIDYVSKTNSRNGNITLVGVSHQAELAAVLLGDLKVLEALPITELQTNIKSRFIKHWRRYKDLLELGKVEPITRCLVSADINSEKSSKEKKLVSRKQIRETLSVLKLKTL